MHTSDNQKYGSLRAKIAAESLQRKERYANFRAVYDRAYTAGLEAGKAATPRPIVVGTPTPEGQINYAKEHWYSPEGCCGFAWVRIYPGSCSFARWLIKNNLGSSAYRGGVDIWISDHGQSIERKEKHARAMAEVITSELGVKAYAGSRLD